MNVYPNLPIAIRLKRLVIYGAIFMLVGSSTHTAIGQVYEPDSTVLGKTMTDRLAEWVNWNLSSRESAHSKDTSGERIYENQQGPIFYLPRGVRTLEVESEVDVPHDAPLWLHFLGSSAWEHGEEGNRNIARNNFRFPTDHEVFVDGDRVDANFLDHRHEAAFMAVNRETTGPYPIGTFDTYYVSNFVVLEPLEPGSHIVEWSYLLDGSRRYRRVPVNVFVAQSELLAPGEIYTQDFNNLGTDGAEVKTALPSAWTVTDEWAFALQRDTDAEFPIRTRPRPGAFPYVTNAGVPGEDDRALSIYMPRDTESRSLESDVSQIQFLASVNGHADSLQLQFDIEAWDANISSRSAELGEAAFDVTIELNSGNGFEPFLDLGKVTTGELPKPEGEYLNGNDPANRVSFDSGVLPASIPDGSQLRFRWAAALDGNSDGWVFGLDDVSLNLYDSITIPFDCNGDGILSVVDADCSSTASLQEMLTAANLIQGDADGDGQVDFSDFLVLSANFETQGQYTDGDFDKNGRVQFADFLILSKNFGQSAATATVPEPSNQALMLIGVVGLALRRRW